MRHLRIVTCNIAHGRGLTPIQGLTSSRKIRVNLRRIAALLRTLHRTYGNRLLDMHYICTTLAA